MLESIRRRYRLPSRGDLQALSEQIDALAKQVDDLSKIPGRGRPQAPPES
jgi:polyhydroxyalkanoate synthesis regulator phasin